MYRTSADNEGYQRTQFLLPEKIMDHVIYKIHSSLFNGHLGRNKTASKIIERMYQPFLVKRIEQCIKSCDTCQKIKKTQDKKLAQLIYLKPYRANQLITTDRAGPFKETIWRTNTIW